MAFFSNGTEGQVYTEKYCQNCIHDSDEEMCPVWDLHLDFAYELCNEHDSPGKIILDRLIPMDDDRWPQKCSMFITR